MAEEPSPRVWKVNNGELPALWRLLCAFGIVFGLIFFGLIFVYSWFFVAPLVVVVALAIFGIKKARRSEDRGPLTPGEN